MRVGLKTEIRLFKVLGTRVWWTLSHHLYLVCELEITDKEFTPRVYCTLFGKRFSINTNTQEDLEWKSDKHIGYFTRRLRNPLEFFFGNFELEL